MCQGQNGTGFCIDGWKDSYREFITSTRKEDGVSEHSRDYYTHTGTTAAAIGILKNHDTDINQWRCFANPSANQCHVTNNTSNCSFAKLG